MNSLMEELRISPISARRTIAGLWITSRVALLLPSLRAFAMVHWERCRHCPALGREIVPQDRMGISKLVPVWFYSFPDSGHERCSDDMILGARERAADQVARRESNVKPYRRC